MDRQFHPPHTTMMCTTCKHGTQKEGFVTITMQRENSIVLIKSVPALVCENCGDFSLTEEVAQRIMEIATEATKHHPEIEVLQYAA